MSNSKPVQGYKRNNFYIDRDFQNKFIVKFCAIVLGGGLFTIALLYYLSRLSTTVVIINSRVSVMSTSDFMLPILMQTVLIVTVLIAIATIIVTLFVSHKIVGPLY